MSKTSIMSYSILIMLSIISTSLADNSCSNTSDCNNFAEQIENLGRVYKDDNNQTLQELWLLGRYHGQYYWTRGSLADDNDYESRRIRFGTQAKFFKNLTVHAQAISGSDFSPSYNGFTELWTQWAFSPEFKLTAGQQKHRFTHDRNVSSRYLNYLERSQLTNMFSADYSPAITLQGDIGKTSYYSGLFSNATEKNMQQAFSDLNSGHSFLAAAYQDITDYTDADSTYLHASVLISDANQNANLLNNYDNSFSTAFILTEGSFSLVNEITAGTGSDKGNVYGINFQPGLFLTDKLQLATRYQLAISNEEKGLRPQNRYDRTVDMPEGDQYQAFYIGLNYYLAKHRLKLMHGVEYSHMSGEQVWTFSSMIRFYFGPHSGGAFPMNQRLHGVFDEYD